MTLRGKMHDRSGPLLIEQAADQSTIHNVAAHKAVSALLLHRSQILQIPRVRQLVQNGNRRLLFGQPLQHKIGADEACSTGHQNR